MLRKASIESKYGTLKSRMRRWSEYWPGNLIDFELDAVSGQNEHLVDKRNGHAIREELRIHSHLSRSLSLSVFSDPPTGIKISPRRVAWGITEWMNEPDTSLKLFARSCRILQHPPALSATFSSSTILKLSLNFFF